MSFICRRSNFHNQKQLAATEQKDGYNMRTIRTKVYSFNELSDNAKQVAVNGFLGNIETDFVYEQANDTVKAFHKVFGTKESGRSWLDANTDRIDNDILELKGLRLQKYIWNNFKTALYKGKYFSLWSKTEKSYKHYKEGYPVLKSRHSRVLLDNSCPLTGVCYDNSLLQPMYDFLDNYKSRPDYHSYMDFETLINDCFSNLEKDIESEVEAMNTYEYIAEHIEANEYEFTQDGTRFK